LPQLSARKRFGFVTLTLLGILAVVLLFALSFTFYSYRKYARLIEEKLSAGPFVKTSRLFANPRTIRTGDPYELEQIVSHLRHAGYTAKQGNLRGWYHLRPDAIEIYPGPDSYFREDPFVLKVSQGRIQEIISLRDNTRRNQCQLEPGLLTNLFDRRRQKRQVLKFEEFPPLLVAAVVSVEDKRFFQHAGFDPLRIVKAAYVDLKKGYREQGASTLTMQLARGLWLTPEKTFQRKAAETLITLHLERTLTKEQIFEYYANNVDMGRRGSYHILGFGEASRAYFGKDVTKLSLAECATIAGLIQRPSFTNPVRWPERAKARRNVVLSLMRDNGYINDRDYALAAAEPLVTAPGAIDSNEAPYFVDLVNEWLQDNLQNHDFQSENYRVYTTLDPQLQKAAMEAVQAGIAEVDALIAKRRQRTKTEGPEPQVALVALDAQTGEIRALVGGRNYGVSQLNRALAKRQPGSIFKPFVYAAAIDTAVNRLDGVTVLTPESLVDDEPTVFEFDGQTYEPGNFGSKFYGVVTMRTALAKSLNVPTVKIAQDVGYGHVAALARSAGLQGQMGTPAVALGSYDATPLDMAGAYTVFVNGGEYVKPSMIHAIFDSSGKRIYENKITRKEVLDPRVAYVMVNMMEEVLRSGTGAGVRSRGFKLPAAGKTGTSRDGWFAGFTSKLICVVWVGFDDGTDLKLEGAKAALPIWTEFMKRAHDIVEYRNPVPFAPPAGVTLVSACGTGAPEAFVSGTEPASPCGRETLAASWDETDPASSQPAATATARVREPRADVSIPLPPDEPGEEQPKKKRNLWERIRGIFK
jgi:penicillin-binding protein 1B